MEKDKVEKEKIEKLNMFLQKPEVELTAVELPIRKKLVELSVKRDQLRNTIQSHQQTLSQAQADLIGTDASLNTLLQMAVELAEGYELPSEPVLVDAEKALTSKPKKASKDKLAKSDTVDVG